MSAQGRLPLKVKNFEFLGTLHDDNGHKYTRDIGCSSVFGGQVIWLFGDTFPLNSKGQMIGLLTSTAAIGNIREPTRSKYWNCRENGHPQQFIPFTNEEDSFNKTHSSGGKERFYLWSFSSIVEIDPGKGWLFFTKGRTQSRNLSDNIQYGVQVARVHFDNDRKIPIAERCMDKPLFDKDQISWGSFEVLLNHDHLYLYGGKGGHIYVARVPKESPLDKSKYEYWTKDEKWSKEEKNLKDLFWKLQSGSIFWSRFYKSFILLANTGWADSRIVMRSAPHAEGPWTQDVTCYQLEKNPKGMKYCVNAHPWAFPESNGGQVLVTWTDQHTGVVECGKLTWEGYEGRFQLFPIHQQRVQIVGPSEFNLDGYGNPRIDSFSQVGQSYGTPLPFNYNSDWPQTNQPYYPQYGNFGYPQQFLSPSSPNCNSTSWTPLTYNPSSYTPSNGHYIQDNYNGSNTPQGNYQCPLPNSQLRNPNQTNEAPQVPYWSKPR
ncbi:uncharacterized protein V1516DRAFT_686583 [Lipomyces oligophaga]|uniref:uncharacterized protein n=1 Tax=Lipomyces oligophaga TaxID=45792 RepID=UPI0034CFFA93